MKIRALAVAAVAAGALASAQPALAASWKRVTTPDGGSIDQVGLARTADGTLHLAWHHPTGPNTEDLLHTTISPEGAVGASNPIQSGWTGFSDPALVVTPTGLQAFWGGFRTTDTNDPQNDLNHAASADGGATWALTTGSIIPGGAQAYASDIAATVLADGTTLQTWSGTLGTWVHAGLSPASPNHDFQAPLGSYGYEPNLATDASGQTMLAWYSNATGHLGVLTQGVAPDGSPTGAVATLPGTETLNTGGLFRTPIVARVGGGFFTAYESGRPAADRIRVWRVGAPSSTVVSRTNGLGNQPTAVAADDEGRIWVAWVQSTDDGQRVFARRSNEDATKFGETIDAGRATDSQSAYGVDASVAPGGELDLLGVFNIGTSSNAATYYARIKPALTIDVVKKRKLRNGDQQLRFRVTDAGEPVAGVRMKVGGATGRTDSAGLVTINVGRKKKVTAKATLGGYTTPSEQVRVRR